MNKAEIFTRLDTVIVRVKYLAAARKWYEDKLGFRPSFADNNEKLVVFDVGGTTSLTIWQLKPGDKPAPAGTAGVFPIFLAENAGDARKTLSGRGVEVTAIREGGGIRWFRFHDLDGNPLEVCQSI